GHIMDLPKSKLGISLDDNFAPQYDVVADKKKIIAELQTAAKTADTIILATDPDREGEAIASHIAEVLTKNAKSSEKRENNDSRNSQKNSRKFVRIVFHEITEAAIKEALQSPREIDKQLVDAQTARRVLD